LIGTISPRKQDQFTAGHILEIPGEWRKENLRAVVFLQERVCLTVLGKRSWRTLQRAAASFSSPKGAGETTQHGLKPTPAR